MRVPDESSRSGDEVDSADLIDHARRAGFAVDRRHLKTLRREGVLQHGRQVHSRGVEGSQTRYPAAAKDQLLLVLRLREHERRFDSLRFLVWWHGGWVDPQLLRASIGRRLEYAGLRDVRRLVERYPDPIDA